MSPWTYPPVLGFTGLCCDRLEFSLNQVRLAMHSVAASASCPVCGQSSERVHSRYRRTLADLPWQGIPVRVGLTARRFFCDHPDCPQRIFTERLPGLADRNARRTPRLLQAQGTIGLALGGEAGARLAGRLGMPTSADSLLRAVHGLALPAMVTPGVLGVDDWALCRGQRYGTILCDLERHCPIDLLQERSSEVLRLWLQAHPGVRVISRDRGDDYAKGATAGAPAATQVADRWHLLHNLHEVLTRIADRCHTQVRAAARQATRKSSSIAIPLPDPPSPGLDSPRPTVAQTLIQQRRARRWALYQQVVDLYRQGLSRREISKRLGLGRQRVRHFVSAGAFPERAKRMPRGQVAAHEEFLRRRWGEGCHNARTLTAELVGQGRSVSYHAVRRWVGRWRSRPWMQQESVENELVPPVPAALPRCSSSPNAVAWLMQRAAEDLNDQEQALVDGLQRLCPDLATGAVLAGAFSNLIHGHRVVDLDAWIALAQEPGSVPEMVTFAHGLMQDYNAVQAAVALPWSNGQVEGQVNRLKLIKRQMYGRASFDLLRRRFLCAG